MAALFGRNSFTIRSFSLKDLGIEQNEEPDIRIEAQQIYFHLFRIPFLGVGKKWVARKGDQPYEMPPNLQMLLETSDTATSVRAPFYTYAGPLLIILGLLIYQMNERYSAYKSKQWATIAFNAEKAKLESKMQHLTTNDFITIQQVGDTWNDTFFYLKIENINGDEITVTPVETIKSSQYFPAHAWEVEDGYNCDTSALPGVKISYKQLEAACLKEYISPIDKNALKQQGIDLLKDGSSYLITDVVRHFGSVIFRRGTGGYGGPELVIDMRSEGWPATISDIKELTGNGDWSGNLNKEVPGRVLDDVYGPAFRLHAIDCEIEKPYKIVMTLKDTTGQLRTYEIAGVKLDFNVRAL